MSFSFTLPMITDGSGSCSDVSGDDPYNVCCENTVLQNPELLISLQESAVQNGASALLSPTELVSHSRLEDLGFDDSFSEFIEELTQLTIKNSSGLPVGGVISESHRHSDEYGKNVFESAYFAHLEKITLLKDNGASFILIKNFSKLWDMRAGVLAAETADIPVFVIMKVDDEGRTESDTDFIAALITLQSLGADAFGIECTEGIEQTAALIKKAFPHAEIPLIAAVDMSCTSTAQIEELSLAGASVYIDTSGKLSKEKTDFIKAQNIKFDSTEEKDSYAAAIFREAFFLPESLEFSEPLSCSYDMSDEIIELDDSSADAVYIRLNSTDDASYLADNAIMSYLPFIIHTNDTTTLEAALRYYQGRLIVDSHCEIEEQVLTELAEKYGAILY